jgi:molybdenum cofactor cytidylyltransferase
MPPIIAQRPRPARDSRRLAVLVLAAGASRRLGRPKQLVRCAGEPLVRRITRLAATLNPLWLGVVVGARAGAVIAALAGSGAVIVPARRWREGMSASLRAGVRASPRGARLILVLSADQWRVTARDLARLVRAAGRVPAAAAYAGHVGIPAVFPAHLRSPLLRLSGDRGARAVLAMGRFAEVPMPAAAIDLDTPADLARLRGTRPAR